MCTHAWLQRFVTARTQTQVNACGGALLLVLVVVFIALAIPAWGSRSERRDLQDALRASDARLERTRAQIDQVRRDAKSLAATPTQLQQRASAGSLDHRLIDVSSIASGLGLVVDSVEPGAVSKRPSGEPITAITANGRGTYARVVTFLQQLRERAPDLTVESLQLTAAADGGCAFQLALNWWNPPASPTSSVASLDGGDHK